MTFLTNINLNKNELQNAVIQNLSTAPANPKVGQIYFNTSDQMMYQYKQISSSPATYAWETVGEQDTNTTYTFTGGTNGFTVTPSDGEAQTVTVTPSITNNVTGSGTSGKLTKWNGTNTITDGPALSSSISTQTQSTKFLREDGTWAAPSYTVDTNTATAADNILDGSNSGTEITYAPYSTQQSKLSFDTSSTAPSRTDRLNLNGYLYATKLYSGGNEVLTSHQSLADYVKKDGTVAMTGNLNLDSHKITNVTDPTSNQDAATKNYVDTAISGLPTPMQFKGTVGTSGTVEWSALPSAGSTNEGYTYKVITDHATDPVCKAGDTIVSNGSSWVVIPSGDEPSGTVTNVATGSGLTGGPITSTGTISLATAYGDTVNPYGVKTKNYVLAGPDGSSGHTSDAVPTFRALVAADIPDLSGTYQAKGNYKTTQTAVSDPSVEGGATALEFISNITQNTNGVISPTKKKVTADATPTENSNNLVTSGGVYTAIQTISGGSVHKIVVKNSALTASGGAWTWSITNTLGTSEVNINVYDLSTGAQVIPEIVVHQSSGDITITINDTAGATTLAADSYKAVIVG